MKLLENWIEKRRLNNELERINDRIPEIEGCIDRLKKIVADYADGVAIIGLRISDKPGGIGFYYGPDKDFEITLGKVSVPGIAAGAIKGAIKACEDEIADLERKGEELAKSLNELDNNLKKHQRHVDIQ